MSKINIGLKEVVETEYWLRLLYASDYLCDELVKILVASVRTIRN